MEKKEENNVYFMPISYKRNLHVRRNYPQNNRHKLQSIIVLKI